MGVIDGLLALTRDQAPARRMVDVEGVVREALDTVRPRSGVEVSAEIEPGMPYVSVDPVQLQQVVVNLVTNAMQAITGDGRGGRVCVHAGLRDGALVVTVDDDGPGLAAEVKARLFEPLFTTRLKGVGLGLALCRRIAERHGGGLRATNRESGGASFVVTFQAGTGT
jgi:signal transduction histidine kinase